MKTLQLRTAASIACAAGLLATIALGDSPAPPKEKAAAKPIAVRLEFNPGGGPWEGEKAFQGATWNALGPGLGNAKGLTMQARAGIGDKFPVGDRQGTQHFEVILQNGVDDHLEVLITSGEGEQKVRLPRDKKVEVSVGGGKYTLLYPTTRVAAPAGSRPSTNKATIFVTQLP